MVAFLKSVVAFISNAIVRRPVSTALLLIGGVEVISSTATRLLRWLPLEVADVLSLFLASGTTTLYYFHSDQTPRQLILTISTACWSIRLGVFLLYRTMKGFRDNRLDNMRTSPRGALNWCIAQTVWIFLTCCPIWVGMHANRATTTPLGTPMDIVGIAGFVTGWLLEAIADIQRANYVARRQAGKLDENVKFCHEGLFKLCRFPNYFGEFLMWSSLSLFAFNTTTHWSKYSLPITPWFLYALFHKVSIKLAVEKMKGKLSKEEFEQWSQIPLFFPSLPSS